MNISAPGLTFLRGDEACRFEPCADDKGLMTIGWGHNIMPDEKFTTLDQCGCDALFLKDLAPVEACINRLVIVTINQNQYDAMVSFAFNIGIGSFSASTLLKLLNRGFFTYAAQEFLRWSKERKSTGCVFSPSLANRRIEEAALFMEEVDDEKQIWSQDRAFYRSELHSSRADSECCSEIQQHIAFQADSRTAEKWPSMKDLTA